MITQILKIDLTLGKTSERNKIENDKQNSPQGEFCVAKFCGRSRVEIESRTNAVRSLWEGDRHDRT